MRRGQGRVDELVALILPRVPLAAHLRPSMLLDESVVPPAKVAAKVLALRELVRRGGREDELVGFHITKSTDVEAYFRPKLGADTMESLHVLGLDARNRVRFEECVARGGISSCAVTPTQILRPLVLNACAGGIVVHNHPSGDPSPSAEDIALTDRIAAGATAVGVKLVDHVIVARERTFSFLDAQLLRRT